MFLSRTIRAAPLGRQGLSARDAVTAGGRHAQFRSLSKARRAKKPVTVVDVAPAEALRAQQFRLAMMNNAIERRSDYFDELVSLCGLEGKEDICRQVGNLHRLTEHEKNVREVFSSLGSAAACDAAEDQEDIPTVQSLTAELAKVSRISGNLTGQLRSSVYKGIEAVDSVAVVTGELLQDTLTRVQLSQSTLYRFNLPRGESVAT